MSTTKKKNLRRSILSVGVTKSYKSSAWNATLLFTLLLEKLCQKQNFLDTLLPSGVDIFVASEFTCRDEYRRA